MAKKVEPVKVLIIVEDGLVQSVESTAPVQYVVKDKDASQVGRDMDCDFFDADLVELDYLMERAEATELDEDDDEEESPEDEEDPEDDKHDRDEDGDYVRDDE